MVGWEETGTQGGEDALQVGGWWTRWARQQLAEQAVPHSRAGKPGGTTGEWDRPCNPGFQCRGNKTSKPLTEKICGGWGGRRNSQPHRWDHWRDPQGPRTYTNPPTRKSAPEGPNFLVGSSGELSRGHCSLSDPSPTDSATTQWVCCPSLVNT